MSSKAQAIFVGCHCEPALSLPWDLGLVYDAFAGQFPRRLLQSP